MKQQINRLLCLLAVVVLISSTSPGCKSKPKDADIKSSVEAALQANPSTSGLMATVNDGVVTISGTAADESAKAKASELANSVEGVKSVQNNVSVATPPPAVEITADDPLTTAVRDATKDYPTVTATVNDGIISVNGEIKTDAWKKLKMTLDGLRPKRVDASGLKIIK